MPRVVASVLTLLFSWLLVLPVFASSAESTLLPCCRKAGKHHCAMHVAQAENTGPAVTAIAEKCPCAQHAATASQVQYSTPTIGKSIFADLVRHPSVCPQTEASYRISYDRSRQKRGPPSLILS